VTTRYASLVLHTFASKLIHGPGAPLSPRVWLAMAFQPFLSVSSYSLDKGMTMIVGGEVGVACSRKGDDNDAFLLSPLCASSL
jgi:hypothetical protein